MTDALDRAVGLAPGDSLYVARRFRPEFVDGAENCRISVMTPADGHGLDAALRIVLARRIALHNDDKPLIAQYDEDLAVLAPDQDILDLHAGATDLPEPLASMVRHVDLVTLFPRDATRDDISHLQNVGLNNAQIVALCELVAFVNFQTRVATGLRLMETA
jgi:uncharacterized protein YciW